MRNVTLLIDPYESILYSAILGRFMDSNIDRKTSLLGFFLKTQDKFTALHRACE